MTKKTDPAPIAPAFPNASIDFNKVLANDAKGKAGEDMLAGALHVPPQEIGGEPADDTGPASTGKPAA